MKLISNTMIQIISRHIDIIVERTITERKFGIDYIGYFLTALEKDNDINFIQLDRIIDELFTKIKELDPSILIELLVSDYKIVRENVKRYV